ncbi:Pyrimidine-specific ribonucleoside hydrolase RihB [Corynebacterium occultum]|uniref:Pyrimidine-specific ribonucleoside hydrolase RihB n=1 Tax=Corynebacterium occultum TaxID=2675219 RepID=A0A6B8VPU0_9CORY|nr:nucleoside hydrolase [Corynebacterium occultum]QGU06103.1 Pyrimidine-specific ribonucleoside hydrolase RihB [Corynebacterium occultum]
MTQAPKKIILDCDPGHDDAVAIILAAGNPAIDLLGITTIGGNQTLPKVTHNALTVLTVLGQTSVPVYAGCTRPLVQPVEVAPDIHGDSGMEIHGYQLPEPAIDVVPDVHAVDYIIDTVMNNEPGTITLVPTGPLTNIALAVRKEPRIAERVKEVVLMGGGYHEGNWSAVAEFNIKVDPEAAHIVFNESWPLTMVGLDLTHQALATAEVEKRLVDLDSDIANFVVGLFGFFRQSYQDAQGFDDPPVHDPCTVAYLIDPTVMTTRKVPLDVELRGALTVGMTVADFRSPAPEDCNTQVAVKLDREKFWDLVIDAVKALS